jgi:hypothetical protein
MRWLSILMLATLAGCASASKNVATPEPTPTNGTYEFTANSPNQLIRGTVLVNAEGTGVQFETPCQPEVTVRRRPSDMPSSLSVMSIYCSGTWLTFDKRNPTNASWYASVELPRRRAVCSRYETQNGRQVCVNWTTETYSVYETRSGGIQVYRVK